MNSENGLTSRLWVIQICNRNDYNFEKANPPNPL